MNARRSRDRHRMRTAAAAVDLAKLRQPQASAEQLAKARHDLLTRQGFICPCGERIRDQGVELYALITQDAGIGFGSTTFHSHDCPSLIQALTTEHGTQTELLCLRPVPPVEWIDETAKEPDDPQSAVCDQPIIGSDTDTARRAS